MGLGIVDSLIGGIGWVAQPVYDWVRRLVSGVVGWVTDWVNHVIDWASEAFDGIRAGLRAVWDFGNEIVNWAAGVVNTAFDRLVTWAGGLIQAARDFARGLFDTLGDWAQGAINRLWDFTNGIFDWAVRNIWDPLWARIEDLGNWVERTVVPWVSGIVGDLADWAEKRVRWVTDHLCELLGPVCPAVSTMWDITQRAWGWLTFIATHPLDWFQAMWNQLADTAPDVIEEMVARAMTDQSGHIERAVVGWFDR